MALSLVSQIVHSGLRPLRNAVANGSRSYTPGQVQELFEACALASVLLDKLWEANNKLLEEGSEGGRLTFVLKETAGAVAECVTAFAGVRAIAANRVTPFEGKEEGLRRLDESLHRAEKIHAELADLLRWLDSSPPRVDPESLPRAGESPTAEGYVSLDALLARQRAGEEG